MSPFVQSSQFGTIYATAVSPGQKLISRYFSSWLNFCSSHPLSAHKIPVLEAEYWNFYENCGSIYHEYFKTSLGNEIFAFIFDIIYKLIKRLFKSVLILYTRTVREVKIVFFAKRWFLHPPCLYSKYLQIYLVRIIFATLL